VLSSVEYASKLVESFKQIVVGEFSEATTEFELKQFLQSIIHIMTPRLKRCAQVIEINCAPQIMITGRAGALSQVIINLINNALIHAFDDDQPGVITMEAVRQADEIIMTLRDDGKGIQSDKSERVFEKYFTTKMGEGGSGLGLFIVKNLVSEQLHGTIVCESSPNQGTSFIMRFPVR
jgi:signal transduction histidine kinase